MQPPASIDDLPYAHLLQPPQAERLRAQERYDTVHFDGLTLDEPGGAGARFLECVLSDCVVQGGTLRGAGFNEVWVTGGRFVAAGLAESDWQDSVVDSCVLAGVEAFGARLRRVVFRRCKLDSVNLRGALLRDVVFEDCLLREVDLAGGKLSGVRFPGSTLERLRLGRATLERTDLRDAVRLDLADGYDALRGATISTAQLLDIAPALAHALGITVADR
jgi:uncharacterized protein YjbI with pentapeptide repeats